MQRAANIITSVFLLISSVHAADVGQSIQLPKLHVDMRNFDKIAEGAHFFKERCFSCHSMKYLRHDQVSLDAGIDPNKAVQWPKQSWDGHPPPDLSLAATTKGAQWLYGYLKGYYVENNGYNNIIWQNTAMPNPYADLQGNQELVMNADQIRVFHPRLYQVLRLESSGTISAHEFNEKIDALIHYLIYASDPSVIERHNLAPMVLAFVLTLVFFAFLLYRDFYKDLD